MKKGALRFNVIWIFRILLFLLFVTNGEHIFAQSKVFIPDTNFRSFLNVNYPTFMDGSGDSLLVDSASTSTGAFNCSFQNIAILTGIEYFINISQLNCSNNQLTTLPVFTSTTSLQLVDCSQNQITTLPDFSSNSALMWLYCGNNQLTVLPDLSSNSLLKLVNCTANQLTSLPDFSNNNALETLYCGRNKLDFSDARELRIADTISALNTYMYSPQDPFGLEANFDLCEGDTLILSIAKQDSALSYQWFRDADTLLGATDTLLTIPNIAQADAGVYTCRSYGTALDSLPMTWGPGISEFVSEPLTTTLNSPVSFAGLDTSYCVDGVAASLIGSPTGGTFNGPGMNGDIFTPDSAEAGAHAVVYTYTDTNGCDASASQNVTVNALPVVAITGLDSSYCVTDAPVNVTGTPSGGTFAGGNISGSLFDPAFAGIGTYTVSYLYYDGNGCLGSVYQDVIVESCVGVEDPLSISSTELVIYPNPSNGQISINVAFSDGTASIIQVFNLTGQLIYTESVSDAIGELIELEIDLSELGKSIYLVQLITNSGVLSQKVIVD